jgi:hypothetical protein
MKRSTITLALAAVLAAAAPTVALAQASAAAAAPAQGSASAVVLSQSTRVLTTLEQRRAEFKSNPAALKAFIKNEFNTAFDGNYAARLVLGVHGRGASDADVSAFADALADNLSALRPVAAGFQLAPARADQVRDPAAQRQGRARVQRDASRERRPGAGGLPAA